MDVNGSCLLPFVFLLPTEARKLNSSGASPREGLPKLRKEWIQRRSSAAGIPSPWSHGRQVVNRILEVDPVVDWLSFLDPRICQWPCNRKRWRLCRYLPYVSIYHTSYFSGLCFRESPKSGQTDGTKTYPSIGSRSSTIKNFGLFFWIPGSNSTWLVVTGTFFFSIYCEFHHPSWQTLIFFRGVGWKTTNQLLITINHY